jgi:histidinol-phosphate aminotransferase
MRLGAAFGQAPLIEALQRVKNSFNSYPIDSLASACALASIADEDYFQRCRQRIIDSRERLASSLAALDFEVLPSQSNFLLASHAGRSAKSLYLELKNAGILLRYFDMPRIDDWLRITIGSDADCDRLLAALRKILG